MKLKKLLQAAAMGGALLSATANAQLEIPNNQYWDEGDADRWRTVISFPMLWAPAITIKAETDTGKTETEIPFKSILENLQFGLLAELYVTKAWWGFFIKAQYMDMGPDEPIELDINVGPAEIKTETDVSLKMGLYDIGMSWRVWRNLRIITLARATQMEVDIESEGGVCVPRPDFLGGGCLPDGPATPLDFKQNIDPGLTWDYNLGLEYGWWMGKTKRHGINLYGDVQAWGDSASTWAVDARYMYRVSKLNNFWLGWRHYEQNLTDDDTGHKTVVSMSGPLVGWAFSF